MRIESDWRGQAGASRPLRPGAGTTTRPRQRRFRLRGYLGGRPPARRAAAPTNPIGPLNCLPTLAVDVLVAQAHHRLAVHLTARTRRVRVVFSVVSIAPAANGSLHPSCTATTTPRPDTFLLQIS